MKYYAEQSRGQLLPTLMRMSQTNHEYDTTKSGEEFKVYATALRVVLAFLKEKIPDNVIIVDKNDPRRLKLYGKMIDKFKTELSSLGYQAQPKDSAIHITKTGVKK